jgi:hypothetical protein
MAGKLKAPSNQPLNHLSIHWYSHLQTRRQHLQERLLRCHLLVGVEQVGIIYIFTHYSIGLGKDGPIHQPIEALENLRNMPNINAF